MKDEQSFTYDQGSHDENPYSSDGYLGIGLANSVFN